MSGPAALAAATRTAPAPASCPPALAPLADQPRWVVWRSIQRGKAKPAKLPYNPRTGEPADTTNPSDWGTLAEALAATQHGHWRTGERGGYRQRYDGVGLVLTQGIPGLTDLAGVDFDHCVAAGIVAPRVQNDLDALSSYTEFSPSGTGVKVLCLGALPSSWHADYCEGYDRDRFFALTFRQVPGTPHTLQSAQAALDALHAQWAPRGRSETPRALGEPRLSAHALAPSGFWDEVAYWQQYQGRLLRADGLPYAMSPQLRALVERGALPAALAAKGTSASERRACVVAQLRRAGYAYGDAEAYVIARTLWRRLGVESSKNERELVADALRLLRVEYPATDAQRHPASLARDRDFARDRDAGRTSDGTPPAAAEPTRSTRRTPADPAAYLAALDEAAVCGVVLLTRPERAALAGIHLKTAQRIEEVLEAEGLIARSKPVRTATGRAVYVQILKRIHEPFLAPDSPGTADVHTPPADGIRTGEELRDNANALGQNTVCPGGPAVAPPPPTPPCPVLPALAAPLVPRELVAEALAACPGAYGRAKFRAVLAYVQANGGRHLAEAAIRRLYDNERTRRHYARRDAALAEKALAEGFNWRRGELRRLAQRMANESHRALVWGHQHKVIAEVHEAQLFAGLSDEEISLNEVADVLALERGPQPKKVLYPVQPPPPSLALPRYGPGYVTDMVKRLQIRQRQEVYGAA